MRRLYKILAIGLAAIILTGVIRSCLIAPKDWYQMTLRYYKEGYSSSWSNERPDLKVYDVLKNRPSKSGYLLTDLDGDGDDELLIGFTDIAGATRFTDIYTWTRSDGAHRALTRGDGCYIYLCADNVIRVDSFSGTDVVSQFLKYDHKSDSFTEVNGEYAPKIMNLNSFWG
ncbi:MAG: hypothetical protein K6F49_05865 [Saccharofermentans sp.]|nr:hypothetical protein [Saccharofermentans sp.]